MQKQLGVTKGVGNNKRDNIKCGEILGIVYGVKKL